MKKRLSRKVRKMLLMVAAMALVLGLAIGGTMAWLLDTTGEVKNTFTPSTINIELDESDNLNLQMKPGATITKDPVITVKATSEAHWLFVEITKSANFADFMTYTISSNHDWQKLDSASTATVDVYYIKVAKTTADTTYQVLANDQVTVLNTVTKAMMDALTEDTNPTLTFKAYAVQEEAATDAAAAWVVAKPAN